MSGRCFSLDLCLDEGLSFEMACAQPRCADWVGPIPRIGSNGRSSAFMVLLQMNGNNGEATNTDDLAQRNHRFVAPGQLARVGNPYAPRVGRRGGNNRGPPPGGVPHALHVAQQLNAPQPPAAPVPPAPNIHIPAVAGAGPQLGPVQQPPAWGQPLVVPPPPPGPPPQQPPVAAPPNQQAPPVPPQPNVVAAGIVPPPPAWPEDPWADDERLVEHARQRFRAAKPPGCRALFHHQEIVLRATHFAFEPLGSPFCGYVAIDLAVGNVPSFDTYLPWRTAANPYTAGTFQQLARYALHVGCNLVIMDGDDPWVARNEALHNPVWRTVFLHYTPGGAGEEGHYKLICRNQSSLNLFQMPTFREPMWWPVPLVIALALTILAYLHGDWRYSLSSTLLLLITPFNIVPFITFGPHQYAGSDADVRAPMDQRDPLEHQDVYCNVSETWWLRFGRIRIYPLPSRKYAASIVLFNNAYKEAQGCVISGFKATKSLPGIMALRGVNTNPSIAGVFVNTARAVELAIKYTMHHNHVLEDGEVVAHNPSAWELVCTQAQLALVAVRQTLAMRGGRTPEAARARRGNHVQMFKPWPKIKIYRPVAWTMHSLWTDVGRLGAGMFPLTDPATLLAAFTVRSMTAREKDRALLQRFVQFSIGFLNHYIDATVFSGVEPPVEEAYRDCQRGKKSSESIDRTLEEYRQHFHGNAPKKFDRNSCFVKFENSAKFRTDGSLGVKPRLIMTMSDLMSIECSPVLRLLDAWNHGPFGKYQVKDVSPEEMMRRVIDMSLMDHKVSDYSSFEASIDEAVRRIELKAMLRMCRRAGFNNTAHAIRRHAFGGRTLHFKGGKFKIFSRCSGDFWTSFGNGVVNVCIMAFCLHMRGINPHKLRMLAEGDDGLVPGSVPDANLIRQLGFGFSTELSGTRPGDCDFLRSRWIDGKRFLNVGRCLNMFWVKKGVNLSLNKKKFLLRCMASSLHHLSPHHPVLAALVTRLYRDTEGAQRFKGYKRYLETWGAKDYRLLKGADFHVDDSMRMEVARGAGEFPGLPVSSQLVLEQRILYDKRIYFGNLLDGFEDFKTMKFSNHLLEPKPPSNTTDAQQLFALFNIRCGGAVQAAPT